MATVVILGGGVGGVVAAIELKKRVNGAHRVVLIDRTGQHLFAPSLLWLMLGLREGREITRDLGALQRKGIEVVRAEVEGIDLKAQRVGTSAGEISYDYLVIALGADASPEAMPGLGEVAHSVYDLRGAERLRDALRSFEGGRVAVAIASLPFKCPAAPYEAAMLMESAFTHRGIRSRVELNVYTPETLPMPVAGPEVGRLVKELVESKGIGFHPQLKLVGVDPGRKTLRFDGGREEQFDFLLAIPPHRPPRAIRESGITNEAGWIPVEKWSMETPAGNVYALGDVTAIKLPNGLMLPKAGVFAHAQAKAVAERLAARLKGAPGEAKFSGDGY
jgi:sulfide:quinone oxidoreductase